MCSIPAGQLVLFWFNLGLFKQNLLGQPLFDKTPETRQEKGQRHERNGVEQTWTPATVTPLGHGFVVKTGKLEQFPRMSFILFYCL